MTIATQSTSNISCEPASDAPASGRGSSVDNVRDYYAIVSKSFGYIVGSGGRNRDAQHNTREHLLSGMASADKPDFDIVWVTPSEGALLLRKPWCYLYYDWELGRIVVNRTGKPWTHNPTKPAAALTPKTPVNS